MGAATAPVTTPDRISHGAPSCVQRCPLSASRATCGWQREFASPMRHRRPRPGPGKYPSRQNASAPFAARPPHPYLRAAGLVDGRFERNPILRRELLKFRSMHIYHLTVVCRHEAAGSSFTAPMGNEKGRTRVRPFRDCLWLAPMPQRPRPFGARCRRLFSSRPAGCGRSGQASCAWRFPRPASS